MLEYPVRLSAATFVLTWEHTDTVDELPTVLALPSPGADAAERATAEAEAGRELVGFGHRDRLAAELEQAYHVLAWADQEFFGYLRRADATGYSAMVARRGRLGVAAVLGEDAIELRTLDPEADLAAELVAMLPECPGARMEPVSALPDDFLGRTSARDENGFPLPPGSVVPPAARWLRALDAAAAGARGELLAAARSRRGAARRECATPVSYVDTDTGRVLLMLGHAPGGRETVEARGGDPRALTEALRRLAASLPLTGS
jgi:hypothetical protein